jgi:long-chain acyl-CoA synthetase
VKAFVVLRPNKQVSEADLLAFCAERLAPFKVPRSVAFRTDLPKTTVGKPLRRVLAEETRRTADEDVP